MQGSEPPALLPLAMPAGRPLFITNSVVTGVWAADHRLVLAPVVDGATEHGEDFYPELQRHRPNDKAVTQ